MIRVGKGEKVPYTEGDEYPEGSLRRSVYYDSKNKPFKKTRSVRMIRKNKKKPKPKLEKSIEKSAIDEMREDGAMVAKLNLMGQKAWPDRLIFPPGAKIRIFTCWTKQSAMEVYEYMKSHYPRDPFMIEFKRSAEHQLTELQHELQVKIGERKP